LCADLSFYEKPHVVCGVTRGRESVCSWAQYLWEANIFKLVDPTRYNTLL